MFKTNIILLQVYRPNAGMNPITYIDIWEDSQVSIGVFVLKSGAALPLHDHPEMHGIIRVIHGTISVESFSELQEQPIPESITEQLRSWQHHLIKPVKRHNQVDIDTQSNACDLTPTEGNFHAISSVNGPAAFLDILAPPYDHATGSRECHYYKELLHRDFDTNCQESQELTPDSYLIRIPQPSDFFGDSAPYCGPEVNLYENDR